MGFDYFEMKSVLYETLKLEPEELQNAMAEKRFPNISSEKVGEFYDRLLELFPYDFDCSVEQKYLRASFKRAKSHGGMLFFGKR